MNEDRNKIDELFKEFHYADNLGVIKSKVTEYTTTVRQEARAAAFREAVQTLRDRGEDWRLQAERWQRNAQNAGMDIIREQDYIDRDVCLSKMSAAMTLAIELDEVAARKQ